MATPNHNSCTKTVQTQIDRLTAEAHKAMEKVAGIGRKMAVEIYRLGKLLVQLRDAHA